MDSTVPTAKPIRLPSTAPAAAPAGAVPVGAPTSAPLAAPSRAPPKKPDNAGPALRQSEASSSRALGFGVRPAMVNDASLAQPDSGSAIGNRIGMAKRPADRTPTPLSVRQF